MPLTPQEVAGKVFRPTRLRRGYAENEVDAFLDQVEAELSRLTSENEQLRQELQKARGERPAGHDAPPATGGLSAPVVADVAAGAAPTVDAALSAPVPAPDDAGVEQEVARMLVLAQRTADAAVREAKTDADETREAARVEAARVLTEVRARAAEEVGHLERSKTVLENKVEQLQEFDREYRRRLRAYLEMQLRDLELGTGAPAAVEGRGTGALAGGTPAGPAQQPDESLPGASAAADRSDTTQTRDPDPLTTGLTEPTGFGPA